MSWVSKSLGTWISASPSPLSPYMTLVWQVSWEAEAGVKINEQDIYWGWKRRKGIRVGWREKLSRKAVSTKALADLMGVLKMAWPFYWGQRARPSFPCTASLGMQAVPGRGHNHNQGGCLQLCARPRQLGAKDIQLATLLGSWGGGMGDKIFTSKRDLSSTSCTLDTWP